MKELAHGGSPKRMRNTVNLPASGKKGESRTSGVIVPIVVVDGKEKATETPSNKPQKNKKKTRASVEGEPKKLKLLASTMSAAGIGKVYLVLYLKF